MTKTRRRTTRSSAAAVVEEAENQGKGESESPVPTASGGTQDETVAESGIGIRDSSGAAPTLAGEEDMVTTKTASENDSGEQMVVEQPKDTGVETEEKCPACKDGGNVVGEVNEADKESWIRCDTCKTWFHWRCVQSITSTLSSNSASASSSSTPRGPIDIDTIDKWHCKACQLANPLRAQITFKGPARKSSRKKMHQPDYSNLHSGMSPSDSAQNGSGVTGPASGASGVGVGPESNKWIRVLQSKPIKRAPFREMKGYELNKEWAEMDESSMTEPVIVRGKDREGLGLSMPWDWATRPGGGDGEQFGVEDIAKIMGEETPVEVIDVASQTSSPNWTLRRWSDYFHTPPSQRDKIRNVISLEISQNDKLRDMVVPPQLVRDLDWVEQFWPGVATAKNAAAVKKGAPGLKSIGPYPKVQLYALMGVATAWTDWHVDFAGSSVYYHIFNGAKTFYFIRPTIANLSAYERWSGTELQTQVWLGDMCDQVWKVELNTGDTMLIPTGWIHAVYTPMDTLVFGGNFLHGLNVATQLKIRKIEISTKVPKKFRFPLFSRLCWYVAASYLDTLRSKSNTVSPRILKSLLHLANFLVAEARLVDAPSTTGDQHSANGSTTTTQRREAREAVPGDKVKDPAAVSRELRWRVKMALGMGSDDEGAGGSGVNSIGKRKAGITNGHHQHQQQRKKAKVGSPAPTKAVSQPANVSHELASEGEEEERAIFRHFVPKKWERVGEVKGREMSRVGRAKRPPRAPGDGGGGDDANTGEEGDDAWAEKWINCPRSESDAMDVEFDAGPHAGPSIDEIQDEDGEEMKIVTRRDVIMKVRRTERGLERHRIERIVEEWIWDADGEAAPSVAATEAKMEE